MNISLPNDAKIFFEIVSEDSVRAKTISCRPWTFRQHRFSSHHQQLQLLQAIIISNYSFRKSKDCLINVAETSPSFRNYFNFIFAPEVLI